ncbi:MAG: SMU1112c/YaeR family gloxylase I-like metalloprotein [Sphingobacterium sp.]|uniref:SMU1112c/YaeR family gloxylase I-like metalloprotein n=1 Tax=Sphingobacterium sp. JB170 TaxID=1434842 RepID=UPI001C4F0DDD|nr:VOC family protein [Sphingobacterium sp. JB170]
MAIKINRIHHVAIICSNYARSLAFYVDVLGFTLTNEAYRRERDSYKADLSLNSEYVLELFSFPTPPERLSFPEAAGLRHLAFEVDHISETRLSLLRLGVLCEDVRTDPITKKEFFFIADPDGLPIEFYETGS